MASEIDHAIEETLKHEGGYVDHPSDPGGATNWGITERVARANGFSGDMRDLPLEEAKRIYRMQYAVKPGFDAVAGVFPDVGYELFDTGVNMGPAVPSKWLQQCLNALNRQGRDYADIAEDGDIGPATMTALFALKNKRGAKGRKALLKMLNCLQGARYIELARKNPKLEDFMLGWFNRVEL